jgi:hypothetical protein
MQTVITTSEQGMAQDKLDALLLEVERVHRELFARLQNHEVLSHEVSQVTQWVAWHRRIAQQMLKVLRRADEIDQLLHPTNSVASAEAAP